MGTRAIIGIIAALSVSSCSREYVMTTKTVPVYATADGCQTGRDIVGFIPGETRLHALGIAWEKQWPCLRVETVHGVGYITGDAFVWSPRR